MKKQTKKYECSLCAESGLSEAFYTLTSPTEEKRLICKNCIADFYKFVSDGIADDYRLLGNPKNTPF